MSQQMITKKIEQIVEEQCKADTNVFGYGIWTHHIVIVVKYARMLAHRLDADLEIVEISALLHDYASIKDKELYKEHHIHGATEAERILKKLNYPIERIEAVKDCILSHRGSISKEIKTKEALCIASADAMAHIDYIPSLLHLAYVKLEMNTDDGAKWVREKIERSWNKLCPEAREIMLDKYNSAINVLKSNTNIFLK